MVNYSQLTLKHSLMQAGTSELPFLDLALMNVFQISGLVEEETPESRAETIFRIMDLNADGRITR